MGVLPGGKTAEHHGKVLQNKKLRKTKTFNARGRRPGIRTRYTSIDPERVVHSRDKGDCTNLAAVSGRLTQRSSFPALDRGTGVGDDW
jgi:hypothetical protein